MRYYYGLCYPKKCLRSAYAHRIVILANRGKRPIVLAVLGMWKGLEKCLYLRVQILNTNILGFKCTYLQMLPASEDIYTTDKKNFEVLWTVERGCPSTDSTIRRVTNRLHCIKAS